MRSLSHVWSTFYKQLHKRIRPIIPLEPLDVAAAIRKAPVCDRTLRARYLDSAIAHEPDDFVLYRIIGNDLPPRHRLGQSLDNLKFMLAHEPPLPRCEKRWVVNRIVDSGIEVEILRMLRNRGEPVLHLPFVLADYARIEPDFTCLPRPDYLKSQTFARLNLKTRTRIQVAVHRPRSNYVTNNNGARNAALADGKRRAKWVLPFDGNCFFTAAAWTQLTTDILARPWLKYFAVPMARLLDNAAVLDPACQPRANDEPQLVFRRDAAETFNPAFPYGRRSKVELFWRLGIPGPWDYWTDSWWDQPRRALSSEAYQFGPAGWVTRLFSGVTDAEIGSGEAIRKRGIARQEAIKAILERLDRKVRSPPEFR